MATPVDPTEAPRATHVVRLPASSSEAEAAARLAASLAECADSLPVTGRGFHRIEAPVAEADPLAWLMRRPHGSRLYFEIPDDPLALAGLGFARTWSDGLGELHTLARRLAADPASGVLRFLLTNRFDGLPAASSPWAAFGGTRIVLPLIEMRASGDGTTLALNLDLSTPDSRMHIDEALALLAAPAEPWPSAPHFRATRIASEPDESGWGQAVLETLKDIEDGRMEKCVLARTRTYAIDGTLDPFALLRQAAREQPDTFRFGIQVSADRAFVGATPEVLFRRRGGAIESEALAGTRRRDGDEASDERLGAELLASRKDLAEHAYVRQHIQDCLAPLCSGDLDVEGPRLRRLAGLQHLDTQMRGTLHGGASDADLLETLHPTPAVCGVPTPMARKAIETREPFDRGLYAGAVGLLGREEALVTVGIRSALHLGDRITLLAGAGLVRGSDAQAEWRETSDKMRALDRILTSGRIG